MRTVGLLIGGRAVQKKVKATKPKDNKGAEAKKAEEAAKSETATDNKGAEAKAEEAKAGKEEK